MPAQVIHAKGVLVPEWVWFVLVIVVLILLFGGVSNRFR